jgi:hypothetical protein
VTLNVLNGRQNFPVITSAVTGGVVTTVDGTLATYPLAAQYTVQFFSSVTCDPSGYGQGQNFVGSTTVTINAAGNGTFHLGLSPAAPAGQFMTATATDPDNRTSEFSACVLIAAGSTPTFTPTRTATATATPTPTRTATATRTATVGTPVPSTLVPVALKLDPFTNGSGSNGNGILEPREAVFVQPSWQNKGSTPVSPDGTASQFEGPGEPSDYAILDPNASYGTIAAGAVGSCSGTNCYQLAIDPFITGRPAHHWDVTFRETLSTNDSKVWVIHLGASFTDVSPPPMSPPPSPGNSPEAPVNPFYAKIETLFHNGITSGCTATTYCPDQVVTRGQMAIFLAKVMAGGGANVPTSGEANGKPFNCVAGGTSAFTDVEPTDSFCKHAHYLAVQNVTLGCSPDEFCPGANIIRESMAAFIAKALVAPGGGPAVPPTYTDPTTGLSYSCDSLSPSVHFNDVPNTDSFCKHVHYLWAKGIVGGCSVTTFCPTGNVTRDAMAKFLVNAFKLQLYGP